jgi:type I restriction enzyme S subunit
MAEGDQIRRFGEDTTHTTIYFPEIRAFHICLAPKDEQAEIVRRLKLALARIDKLAADAQASSTLLDCLD